MISEASNSKEQISNKDREEYPKLLNLRRERFLTNRIFQRISENMHYEIFKYLAANELLEIKLTNIGGYQLTSNQLLRSRIGNYFNKIYFNLKESSDVKSNTRKIQIIIEQTGILILEFENEKLREKELTMLSQIIKNIPELQGINLSKYCYTVFRC